MQKWEHILIKAVGNVVKEINTMLLEYILDPNTLNGGYSQYAEKSELGYFINNLGLLGWEAIGITSTKGKTGQEIQILYKRPLVDFVDDREEKRQVQPKTTKLSVDAIEELMEFARALDAEIERRDKEPR